MANDHKVVSNSEWLEARKQLLSKEKEFTKLRDQLSQARRALPWEAVVKTYVFDGPTGKQTLPELFEGKSQLIVYHFMFDPAWDAGCPHCSFWADNFERNVVHLKHRDISLVAISLAPYEKLAAYAKRMGWTFKWLSSAASDFNFDYHVSFTPEQMASDEIFYNFNKEPPGAAQREGVSVFFKDPAGKVFHTYSAHARGIDLLNTAYNFIDLTPKGRDEPSEGNPQFWVRRHDEYDK